jgi:hypothetical protein
LFVEVIILKSKHKPINIQSNSTRITLGPPIKLLFGGAPHTDVNFILVLGRQLLTGLTVLIWKSINTRIFIRLILSQKHDNYLTWLPVERLFRELDGEASPAADDSDFRIRKHRKSGPLPFPGCQTRRSKNNLYI